MKRVLTKVPFDYFGDDTSLKIKDDDKFNTHSGFLMTVIFFLAVLGIFIQSFVGMLSRSNPSASTSTLFVDDPQPANIIDLPMAFTLTQRDNTLGYLIPYYHYEINAYVEEWIYQDVGGYKTMIPSPTPMQIGPCEHSYFTGTPELEAIARKLVNLNAFFCIPRTNPVDNFRIQGKIGTVGYRYLKVEFSRCTTLPSCASAADVDAALATTSVIFAYGDSYIDINNFKNPVQFSQGGLYDHLSTPYWREKFINLTPLILDSDEGYLTAGTKHYTGYTVNIGETVFDMPLTTPPNEQVRFTFYIRLSTEQTHVQRSYKKIQDVLAETTGISSTLALIFLILLKPYVKLKKSEEMINQILLVHKEKKSEVTFGDYIKAKFGNKKAKAKMERFKKQEAAIERRTDILHLVQNMFNIERIMYLTYSEDQRILISNVVPHSNDPEELEFKQQFEEEISPQVVRALSNISEKPNKDPVDIALLKHYQTQKVKLLDMEKSGPILLNDTSSCPNSPSNLQFGTTQALSLSPSKFNRPTRILPFPSGTSLMDAKVAEVDGSQIELR